MPYTWLLLSVGTKQPKFELAFCAFSLNVTKYIITSTNGGSPRVLQSYTLPLPMLGFRVAGDLVAAAQNQVVNVSYVSLPA